MIVRRRSYFDLFMVLLCVAMLGVGGLVYAIYNIPNPRSEPEPPPAPVLGVAPELISPVNGASNVDTRPTLSWKPVSDADTYMLQISRFSDFSSICLDTGYLYSDTGYFDGTKTGENSYFFVSDGLQVATQYYWRVFSIFDGGIQGNPRACSEIWTFSTFKPLPAPAPAPAPAPTPAPAPAPAPELELVTSGGLRIPAGSWQYADLPDEGRGNGIYHIRFNNNVSYVVNVYIVRETFPDCTPNAERIEDCFKDIVSKQFARSGEIIVSSPLLVTTEPRYHIFFVNSTSNTDFEVEWGILWEEKY